MQVRVDVLGPLRLFVEGDEVIVPGPKRRALLALLASADGRAVSIESLVDALWPEEPLDDVRAAIQSHVSRLRGHLGPASAQLQGVHGGYRLCLDPGGTDLALAQDLLRRAGGLGSAHACLLLQEARALWRGDALAEFGDVEPLVARAVTAGEVRRRVEAALVDALLRVGDNERTLEMASERLTTEPLSERMVFARMRALHALGRTPDALRAGYDYRQRLRTETGLDPTSALADLEAELAMAAPPNGAIPRPPHRLHGRESELVALQGLLDRERLVTIVGPGGVGKTRLALEVAAGCEPVTAVFLASITDDQALPQAIADALGLRVIRGDTLDACAALLAAGPRVLFVDNCEHVLDGVRQVVQHLTECCPELRVLATSRAPLRLPCEQRLRLAPLLVATPTDSDTEEHSPAVALFVDRATRLDPGFMLAPGELSVVTEIVRRLDGLPLAIELAAARLSVLGLADLHARLDHALDLLSDGQDTRHGTLRHTIRWSYDLLGDDERRLFRHICAFPDGLDLGTAEAVAAELDVDAVPLGALGHLVDCSLLEMTPGTVTRYRMLDTIRAFAGEELARQGESEAATERFVRWALDLAAWISLTTHTSEEGLVDAALRREISNLRAAWSLLRAQGRTRDAIAMVAGLFDATTWRDVTEVWDWSLELAADPDIRDQPEGPAALGLAAVSAWFRGQLDNADTLATAGLSLAGHDEWNCLDAKSLLALSRGDLDAAVRLATAAGEAAPRPSESYGTAALAAAYRGDLTTARALNDRFATVASSPTLEAFHAYVRAEIEALDGDRTQALASYEGAIATARSVGSTFLEGIASVGRLSQFAAAGDTRRALLGYRELIGYWERTGSWVQQWTTLRNLADLLDEVGDRDSALVLHAAADRAPDAPSDARRAAPSRPDLGAEVETATRDRVLQVARDAIDAAIRIRGHPEKEVEGAAHPD